MKRPGAPRDEPVTQADRDYHANRSRGLGGNPTTGAEENLLGYPGTRYWGEHIFVHEFAHAIMTGLRDVDPPMGRRSARPTTPRWPQGSTCMPTGANTTPRRTRASTGPRASSGVLFELRRMLHRRGEGRDAGGACVIRSRAQRADRARLHDTQDRDGRLPCQAHPPGDVRLIRARSLRRGTCPRTAHARAFSTIGPPGRSPVRRLRNRSRSCSRSPAGSEATYAPAGPCLSRNGVQ